MITSAEFPLAAIRDSILIVGGGIGGLTTALALGRRGIGVRVLEEAAEFGAIGYGIQLGPNVFHMFERLGVAEAVLRVSTVPPALVMLNALDGREVARIPTGESFLRRCACGQVMRVTIPRYGWAETPAAAR